ncbi:hypothetical protein J2T60_001690 [Natronospira proteinivora]|uniref:Uncharacterized protein n=1 Tax=Natronospira proteinivora TaxID=1807133 RepID=A0ABT1G9V6_9GAMM|nr:hypothetical protein [Natronospira proteinivora]MCP1727690.1 hypothetical protein [Natronospira proteinivora]
MIRTLRGWTAVSLLLFANGLLAESWQLTLDEWSRPRSGEVVMEMPAVADAVLAWHGDSEQALEVVYPGGEQGEIWASELRGWLVALGVDASAIRLQAGAPSEDQVVLRIR